MPDISKRQGLIIVYLPIIIIGVVLYFVFDFSIVGSIISAFIGFFICFMIYAFIPTSKDREYNQKQIKRAIIRTENKSKQIENLKNTANSVYFSFDESKFLALYEDKCIFGTTGSATSKLMFDDILWVKLRIDDTAVIKKSTKNVVGRSIVGGFVGGGAGSMIGGLSGKSHVEKIYNKIDVVIGVKNLNESTITLNYYESNPRNKGKKEEIEFSQNMLRYAQKVTDVFTSIIESNTNSIDRKFISENSFNSNIADEIIKLKNLLDSNAITEVEYTTLKNKLLQ